MKEFFGLANYSDGEYSYLREAEGAWSWQHILFVSIFMIAMVTLAIFFGTRNKNKPIKEKNKVLTVSAILIDSFEIVKIIVLCIRCQDPLHWIYVLPLYLCSIQLIAIPLCAFCKEGRIKEAALDFVLTFGILGAVFGTIGATQNYNTFPVISMDNVFSCITHSISGFCSLYIAISGMISLKKKNFGITVSILMLFSIMAYIANLLLAQPNDDGIMVPHNYMFLMRDDGTPYSIFYNLVNGNSVLYPILVIGAFAVYVALFYYIYHLAVNKKG